MAIDTKGDHLITEDAGRKLFYIEKVEDGPELIIRLVTKGQWQVAPNGVYGKLSGSPGFTVWALKQGKPHPTRLRQDLPKPFSSASKAEHEQRRACMCRREFTRGSADHSRVRFTLVLRGGRSCVQSI